MGGIISKIFGGGGKNPANAAQPYLNQIGPMAEKNLGPWAQQGQEAQMQNRGRYSSLVEDPGASYREFQSSYNPTSGFGSKYARYKKAMEGVNNSGGNSHTSFGEEEQARLFQSLMNEDEGNQFDRWQRSLALGLQGNEAVAGRGLNAAGDLTNVQGSTLGSQAGLAYQGQQSENDAKAGFRKFLMQLVGGGLSAMGGPIGAIAGGAMGAIGNNASSGGNEREFGLRLPGIGGQGRGR